MGKKFQTSQLKQCTEHFCVLYSTAFSSKSQVPIKSRQCICVGLSCSLFAIFHPGCHFPNCITKVLTLCHPKSEVTSRSCSDSWCQKCALCNNTRQIHVTKWLLSISTLVAPQLFKELFRQRIKCTEAFPKECLKAYSYAPTAAYAWVNPTRHQSCKMNISGLKTK